MANRMSLFYANPTPMLHTLSGAAEKLLQEVGGGLLLELINISLYSESRADFREYDQLFLCHGLGVSSHQ